MNEQKRLIKNTGIIAIGNLSTKLMSFFLLPLYTTILSTSEYGVLDYIITLSTFCVPFVSLLIDESMFRFLIDCKSEAEKNKVISQSMLIIGMSSMIFLFLALPILFFLKYRYSVYLIAYIFSAVFFGMMCALLRGIGRTDYYAVYNFLVSTVQIVLNVVFIANLHFGVEGMLVAAVIARNVISLFYIFKMRLWKYLSFSRVDKKLVQAMIRYSIPLIPNKISWSIINLSDRIIIMNVLGSTASGLYAISYKFPTLMDTIYGFFYQSWKESSARVVGSSRHDEFYNMIYTYLKKFMYSVVIVMIAVMPFLFQILIDVSYHKALYYVPILLLATYFSNISGFYGGIFTAYKDTNIMGTTTIAAGIINLIINIAFIWKFGLYAAAVSTLIANVVIYVYRKIKVKQYILLKESVFERERAIVVTIVIMILYYSMNMKVQIIGCLTGLIYAVYENRGLAFYILKNLRK